MIGGIVMIETKIELKRCPHCGGSKTYVKPLKFLRYRVVCRTCGASGGNGFTEEEAATEWNRRF